MSVKILLLCSSRLAFPALQEQLFYKTLAAVVVPEHCDETVEHVQFLLAGSGVPLVVVNKSSYVTELQEAIAQYGPTVGLIITFSYKIPPSVYTLPEKGFYNLHPGPLPEYRGPDPVFWQIKNGEKRAGVTLHQLDKGLDTGPVVVKELIRLERTDTYGLLTSKLAQLSAKLTNTLVQLIGFGLAVPSRKQDESKAAYFRRQTAKEVTLDWDGTEAVAIIALINACNPWNKGATTKINQKIVRLLDAELGHKRNGGEETRPGTILAFEQTGFLVATLQQQTIRVRTIYTDEGFLPGVRLQELGVLEGHVFETIA